MQVKKYRFPDAKPEDLKKQPDEYWKERLTPEQFQVTRKGGTECAFTGATYNEHREGKYYCICCNLPLFESSVKFESGTGWPSFWKPVSEQAVEKLSDESHGMFRTEVRCSRCGAHLGHVFDDGPAPTRKRFCMNSASLRFEPLK